MDPYKKTEKNELLQLSGPYFRELFENNLIIFLGHNNVETLSCCNEWHLLYVFFTMKAPALHQSAHVNKGAYLLPRIK